MSPQNRFERDSMNQRKIEAMVEAAAPILLLASGMAAVFVTVYQSLKPDSSPTRGPYIYPELLDKMREDGSFVVYKIQGGELYYMVIDET